MPAEMWSAASVIVAVVALGVSTYLLARQARHMEYERNAVVVLDAVKRLNDPLMIEVFARLAGVSDRYPTDAEIVERYQGSQDERDMALVSSYIEAVACLARRGVIDPSLLVDAEGLGLRKRWQAVREFTYRRRRIQHNDGIGENFEWLAMYSAWWKDVPRPRGARNYDPAQFANVTFSA